jgi:hypothetical protein
VVFSMHPMLNPTQDASADAQTPRAPGAARPSPPNPAQHHLHHILRLAVTQFSNLARCSVITAHHHISSPVPTHMPFTCTSPTCPAFAPHLLHLGHIKVYFRLMELVLGRVARSKVSPLRRPVAGADRPASAGSATHLVLR